MPREAKPKRPPHPARLRLTAPAGPTSPAPAACKGGGVKKARARGESGTIVIAPLVYAPRLRPGQTLQASIYREADGAWTVRCWIDGGMFFKATGIDSYDAAIDRMALGVRRVVPDEIQRPGEIGGQCAGKPVKGRQEIKREKRDSRHVAKVATARTGRN